MLKRTLTATLFVVAIHWCDAVPMPLKETKSECIIRQREAFGCSNLNLSITNRLGWTKFEVHAKGRVEDRYLLIITIEKQAIQFHVYFVEDLTVFAQHAENSAYASPLVVNVNRTHFTYSDSDGHHSRTFTLVYPDSNRSVFNVKFNTNATIPGFRINLIDDTNNARLRGPVWSSSVSANHNTKDAFTLVILVILLALLICFVFAVIAAIIFFVVEQFSRLSRLEGVLQDDDCKVFTNCETKSKKTVRPPMLLPNPHYPHQAKTICNSSFGDTNSVLSLPPPLKLRRFPMSDESLSTLLHAASTPIPSEYDQVFSVAGNSTASYKSFAQPGDYNSDDELSYKQKINYVFPNNFRSDKNMTKYHSALKSSAYSSPFC